MLEPIYNIAFVRGNEEHGLHIPSSQLQQTPVEHFLFEGEHFYLKRDDLLHPYFSGNKARKFRYFLDHEFPHVQRLIGHGSAQANSLYSLAALAKLKGWQLDFYVDHLPSWLQQHPCGNYRAALELGANIISVATQAEYATMTAVDYLQQHILPSTPDCMFVPEGGRCPEAEYGVRQLAGEIAEWASRHQIRGLKVVLPSGTGTTALFLAKYFHEQRMDIGVLTCAVVGGEDYLRQQFYQLAADNSCHPQLLSASKKYHFGKLYQEFYQLWQRLNRSGVTFELLYDPLAWLLMLQYRRQYPQVPLLYIHQGGLLGNISMEQRYRRKYPQLALSADKLIFD